LIKKYITNLFFLTLIFAFISCNNKGNKSDNLLHIQKNLDDYFTALTRLKEFNGVILVYKNDKQLLYRAYNIFDSPDSSSYVTIDNQFDIHSISKLMTYYLIVKLENSGLISKEQTIDKFYPNFPEGHLITIGMLLSHKSGLPRELLNFKGNEFELSSDEIVELAKKQKLLFKPGTDVQYSNVGYEILYNIISKIYGKSFSQCVVDVIFVPLGMNNSGAHFYTNNKRIYHLAKNHVLKDSVIVQVPNILTDEFKTARLFSTAEDLDLFLKQLKNEPYRTALKNKNNIIAKDGGSKGIRAQVYLDLIHNFRFVLLSNYDEMPFFKTIEDIAKILNSEPVELPKELNRKSIELDNEILESYVGSYSFADFDGLVLRVAIENGHLVVFQGDQQIAQLKAESENVFFENPKAAESFTFVKNTSGSYDAMMGWKGIEVKGKRIGL